MTGAELRVDPLTGLKALVGGPLSLDAPEPERDAHPDLFTAQPAFGAHERLPGLSDATAAVPVWRERMRALGEDDAIAYLHATATAEGGDLYALGFVPAAIARERERFNAYMTQTMGANLLGDYVQEEVRRRSRLVGYDAEAVALCPYAPRVAHQVLIAPRSPRARFEDPEAPAGAALLADVLARLKAVGAPAPRAWVRTAPRGASGYCWRIDVVPGPPPPGRLEAGTGVAVTGLAPEQAAAELRAAL